MKIGEILFMAVVFFLVVSIPLVLVPEDFTLSGIFLFWLTLMVAGVTMVKYLRGDFSQKKSP